MKQPNGPKLTAQEAKLIEQLRQHPEMLTRVQSLFDLANTTTGPLKTADQVEELLIQELRQLERVLTDFGCEHSFARAATRVLEHYGFDIGVSAVRSATLAHAQRARTQLKEPYAQSFRVLPSVGVAHVTREAGWGLNSRIHTVGDGAEWILLQSREVFGEQAHFLCDFFHVSEYLGAAAPVCRPAQPDPWRRTQQRRLKSGAAIKVIEALKEELEPQTTPEQEAPVRQGHRYLSNRLDQLDYAGALALGLPIGSGMIESGHRHVLQARLKKAGAAWLPDHADQIAHLRVLRANSQWLSIWN